MKLSPFLISARPTYWLKNLLVVVPLLASGKNLYLTDLAAVLVGVISLSLIASAGYIFNDIVDKRADLETKKSNRPIASGQIKLGSATFFGVVLVSSSLLVSAAILGWAVTLCLMIYLTMSITYTLGLKKLPGLEVLFLGLMHSLRVLIGMVILELETSFWLIGMAFLFFTALAASKRVGGLSEGNAEFERRGYREEDKPWLLSMSAGFFYSSLVVYGIYLTEEGINVDSPLSLSLGLVAFVVFSALIQHLIISSHRQRISSDAMMWLLRNNYAVVFLGVLIMVNVILVRL